MSIIAQTTLPSGEKVVLEHDPYEAAAVQLVVDGTPQSHVCTADPTQLFFSYMRRIGHVIDAVRPAGQAITALHLGGGAFTLPRYVAATRRGSQQKIIEYSGELVDFVRQHLPLPAREPIRVRRGDARAVTAKLPAGLHGAVDIAVVDCFSGSRTPAHLTSAEFYELFPPLLAPGGVLAVNCTDGAGGSFVRGQLATLLKLFPQVAAIGEPQVLKGRRFGNIILLASDSASAWEWLPRAVNAGPHPARLLVDAELREFVGNTKPVTDATAQQSPLPPAGIFG